MIIDLAQDIEIYNSIMHLFQTFEPPTQPKCLTLKHRQFDQQQIKIQLHSSLTIKISYNNSFQLSNQHCSNNPKFIFIIQELDSETTPLKEGESFTFEDCFKCSGKYHLVCLNFPKITAIIEVMATPAEEYIWETPQKQMEKDHHSSHNPVVISPNKQILMEVKEEQKEEQVKDLFENSPFLSSNKSDLAEYEKIISEDEYQYDSLQNKYVKYFRDEFKLWREFFQDKEKDQNHSSKHKENKQLTKENKQLTNQKDVKSNGSGSNNENDAFFDREKSIGSHLHSQQQIHEFNEEQQNSNEKVMKKTNSEYGINIERDHKSCRQKKDEDTIKRLKSGIKNESVEVERKNSIVSWAMEWADSKQQSEVKIKRKKDHYLIQQWMAYLTNSKHIFIYLQNIKCASLCINEVLPIINGGRRANSIIDR